MTTTTAGCPLNVWNGVVLALDEQEVCLFVLVYVCLNLKVEAVIQYDIINNHTLMRVPTTLQCPRRLCVCVRRIIYDIVSR